MYSDYLSVRQIFQSSINLLFDINNEKKIDEYIPTPDGCAILNTYINMVIPDFYKSGDNRSTVLLGPYGKGKSFLLLVLLYLISADSTSPSYKKLVKKIAEVNRGLSDHIEVLNKKEIKLLPVLVNSDYNNLNQAFLIGLTDALSKVNLESIIPETGYSVALQVITQWDEAGFFKEARVKQCFAQEKTDVSSVIAGLKAKNPEIYEKFKAVYSCVSGGMPFNPLIKEDAVNNFSQVLNAIEEEGYSGIFVVFDEFSKFLESGVSNLMEQLNMLQNIFELASRSSNKKQLHVCCVTHKELDFYRKDNDIAKVSAFRAIEGRIKEIRFSSSMLENFSLISKSLLKTKEFESFYKKEKNKYKEIYSLYENISRLDRKTLTATLFKGCFPLNPLAVNALISLSERVAQNERTLFTFIADSSKDSLRTFLQTKNKGLIGVDSIYDYFLPLLKKEEKKIRQICYRADALLVNATNEIEAKIIKAIATSAIIDNSDVLPSTKEYLLSSCNIDEEIGGIILNDLQQKSLIKISLITKAISFASINSKAIDDAVDRYISSHNSSFSLKNVLEELSGEKYIVPRRYNIDNKITRYYKVIFENESTLFDLNSIDFLYNSKDADGLIINLIRAEGREHTPEEIMQTFLSKRKDERIILRYPNTVLDSNFVNRVKEYWALSNMAVSEKESGTDIAELTTIRSELQSELGLLVDEIYSKECKYFPEADVSFRTYINDLFTNVYVLSPVINNEMLNKHVLSKQYQSARNTVVDLILDQGDITDFSETGPIATVYNSVFTEDFENSKTSYAITKIKDYIQQSDAKTSFTELVNMMLEKPYGIREGVLPVLFARVISELPGNFVVTYKLSYVETTASALQSIVAGPEDYQFTLDADVKAKVEYVDLLLSLFNGQRKDNFWDNIKILANAMRHYCNNLPNIVKTANDGKYLKLSKEAVAFRKTFLKFNINAYDDLFTSLPKIIGVSINDLSSVREKIEDIQSELENAYPIFLQEVIHSVKEIFKGTSTESLSSIIELWVSEGKLRDKNINLRNKTDKKLSDLLLKSSLSFDDSEAINVISKIVTGTSISDWQNNRTDYLYDCLKSFKESCEMAETGLKVKIEAFDDSTLSPLGKVLKDYLSSSIEEFGDSISPTETARILQALIEEVL